MYQAKVSKKERNIGCEDLDEKSYLKVGGNYGCNIGGVEKLLKEGHSLEEANKIIQAKATNQNSHPTVKPKALLKYLCDLTSTPTQGIVLDPFAGSMSTALACIDADRHFIMIERDEEYYKIGNARISGYMKMTKKDRFKWWNE